MHQHEGTVMGPLHVTLNSVKAGVKSCSEGCQGVFRQRATDPAMADESRATHPHP